LSSSSYAGKGDSNHPRRDDNVASTSNSYGAGEGDSYPPRTDNDVAYTISGQEGGHPGGIVGVDDTGSRSVAGGASSISMHKTRKRQGTYGTRSVAGGASSISMHETRKRQLNYGTPTKTTLNVTPWSPSRPSSVQKCSHCRKVFRNQTLLLQHLTTHQLKVCNLSNDNRYYNCQRLCEVIA
jgi:hypothetical protein